MASKGLIPLATAGLVTLVDVAAAAGTCQRRLYDCPGWSVSAGAGVGCVLALAVGGGAHSGWWLWNSGCHILVDDDDGAMVVIGSGGRWWWNGNGCWGCLSSRVVVVAVVVER